MGGLQEGSVPASGSAPSIEATSSLPYGSDDAPAAPLPTSTRLTEVLHRHDVSGERAIGIAQGAIVGFVLLLHLAAQLGKGPHLANPWVIFSLAALAVSSAVRLSLARGPQLREWALDILNIADVGVFLFLLWSYQLAYEHPAGGVLKAPSLSLLFALVALRALRFHPRPITVFGAAAVAGWALVVLLAVAKDGFPATTRSYPEYLTSYKILIGAEFERLVALAALVLFLAIATYEARAILSKSAHASDYADALAAARAHLEEAAKERKKVETALAELDQRDAKLSEQNKRFNIALANMSQGLCMFDKDKRLVVCNHRYLDMYGLPRDLATPGTHFRQILEYRVDTGTFCGNAEQYIQERLAAVEEMQASLKIQELNDKRIVAIAHRPMADGGWVATHEDITELRRVEARVVHMAHHDALTDLPNRVLLRKRLTDALSEASRANRSLAVLVLDLDRFKEVNDTLGHPIGDTLLKQVGERLRGSVRGSDTVARLGGDEFSIVLISADAQAEAAALAKRIHVSVAEPFALEGHQAIIGTSIGIAVAPKDGNDPDELLKNADLALYRAKSDGPGQFRFFEPEMDQRMRTRRRLERDLRVALVNGEFALHYQPVVNLERGEVSSFEALLRWHHPEHGMVSPGEFVPLAEETGLIVPIGEWMLRQACAEATRWLEPIRIAVNISATQFKSGNLVQIVVSALASSGLAPSRLELEIAESVLLQDSKSAFEMLAQLHHLGVRVVLDDFGNGSSSLGYLRSFPFDKIKIDRSLIGDLTLDNEDSLAIIRSLAQLGLNLGMETTAEGVETQRQLDLVRSEGCTEMQGSYFSAARPAAEIAKLFLPPPKASTGTA